MTVHASVGREPADSVPPAGDELADAESLGQPPDPASAATFAVKVDGFEGPFDLLLTLIARRRLDLTALALHQVTDDFIAHVRAQGDEWDLDETSQFVVVAATLLDLKASRLLPGEDEADPEDLALLEARDLLFARLLQYKAYKEVSATFDELLNGGIDRVPRTVGLDPALASLLPEVEIPWTLQAFADLAVTALTPKDPPQVQVDHVHAYTVSVREQASLLIGRIRTSGRATFAELIADAPDLLHVVGRFLAVLELYRESAVTLRQDLPMGELVIAWSAGDADVEVDDEFDDDIAAAAPTPVDTTGTDPEAGQEEGNERH